MSSSTNQQRSSLKGLRPHLFADTRVASGLLLSAGLSLSGCDLTQSVPSDEPEDEAPVGWATSDCSNGRRVVVDYINDGDTVTLVTTSEGEEKVRMIGIDTAEYWPEDERECYSEEARAYTTAAIDGIEVCLTYDPAVTADSNNIDAYGRTLAYVFFGTELTRFLNAELLIEGLAEDFAFTDGAMFEEYFADLENEAQADGTGRWGACENTETHGDP